MKNVMKKSIILALAAVMAMALCACSSESSEASTQMVNPITETDQSGLYEATGFELDAPEGAEDVVYSYVDLSSGGSKGSMIAQVDFKLDGNSYNYRAQATDETVLVEDTDIDVDIDKLTEELDAAVEKGAALAGLYYDDWNAVTLVEIASIDGVYGQSHESVSFAAWIDGGLMYALTAEEEVEQDLLLKAAASVFTPAQ